MTDETEQYYVLPESEYYLPSRLPHNRQDLVYIVGPIEKCYKIGVTNNLAQRILYLGMPIEPKVVIVFRSKNTWAVEKFLHVCFYNHHVKGEWFRIPQSDVEFLQSHDNIESGKDVHPYLTQLFHKWVDACAKSSDRVFRIASKYGPLIYLPSTEARKRREEFRMMYEKPGLAKKKGLL